LGHTHGFFLVIQLVPLVSYIRKRLNSFSIAFAGIFLSLGPGPTYILSKVGVPGGNSILRGIG